MNKKILNNSTIQKNKSTTTDHDIKAMNDRINEIEDAFYKTLSGIPFVIDHIGMLCPPYGYVLVVGPNLGERLNKLKSE